VNASDWKEPVSRMAFLKVNLLGGISLRKTEAGAPVTTVTGGFEEKGGGEGEE